MKAFVYRDSWDASIEEIATLESPTSDEVLIEIMATGICGTDVGILSGAYSAESGTVLGHESSGVVVEIGSNVTEFEVGDRVVIDPTYYCGQCRLCRTNRQNHCLSKHGTETGVSRDGTFAHFHKTTSSFLHKIPDTLSFEAASLTEPLSCTLTGIAQLNLHAAKRVIVLGGGPMGVLYCWGLASKGLSGVLVENAPERQELCKSILGKDWSIFSSLDDAGAYFSEENTPFDIVIDTTGKLAGPAIEKLERGGQYLAVGLKAHKETLSIDSFADRSLSLIGSIDSLNNSFSEALALIQSGIVPADKLVTHKFPLSDIEKGFELIGCDLHDKKLQPPKNALKVVIQPHL